MPLPLFLFSHTPKTGGTTIIDLAQQMCGDAGRVVVQRHPQDMTVIEDLPGKIESGVTFIAGHIPVPVLADLRAEAPLHDVRVVASIRDVRGQFVSAFYHAKHFLGSDSSRPDAQTPAELLATHSPDHPFDAAVTNLQTRYLGGHIEGELTVDRVDTAFEQMSRIDFFFDIDDIAASVQHFADTFGLPMPPAIPDLNGNPRIRLGEDLDDVDREPALFARVLAPDLALVQMVRTRVRTERLRQQGMGASPPALLAESNALHISEYARRSRSTNLSAEVPELLEFHNNDITLQPGKDVPSVLTLELSGDVHHDGENAHFRCGLGLPTTCRTSVRFGVRVQCDQDASVEVRWLNPGQETTLEFQVPRPTSSLTIQLETESASRDTDYAWARFVDPRIV